MRPKTAFLAPRGGQGTFVLTVVAYATFPTLRVPDAHGTPTHMYTLYTFAHASPNNDTDDVYFLLFVTLYPIMLPEATIVNLSIFTNINLAHGVVILTPQVTTTLAYVFHQE